MKTLRELREDGERHLKKAGELLATADLLRTLTADAAKANVLSPEFAEDANAAAKELYDNHEQSKVFVRDVNQLLQTATIQTMNERFEKLLEQQAAAIVRYNSLLEKYEASEATASESGDAQAPQAVDPG
jgi:hypothetical protein